MICTRVQHPTKQIIGRDELNIQQNWLCVLNWKSPASLEWREEKKSIHDFANCRTTKMNKSNTKFKQQKKKYNNHQDVEKQQKKKLHTKCSKTNKIHAELFSNIVPYYKEIYYICNIRLCYKKWDAAKYIYIVYKI